MAAVAFLVVILFVVCTAAAVIAAWSFLLVLDLLLRSCRGEVIP